MRHFTDKTATPTHPRAVEGQAYLRFTSAVHDYSTSSACEEHRLPLVYSWATGIGSYESRTLDGRCWIRSNYGKTTLSAGCDDVCLGQRYLSASTALKAIIAYRDKHPKAGV